MTLPNGSGQCCSEMRLEQGAMLRVMVLGDRLTIGSHLQHL